MSVYKYLYGPIPSRRLGKSLGISPTLEKTCNYHCIYCQLGKTKVLLHEPQKIVDIQDILDEFDYFMKNPEPFDVVSIVGNGEPTLEIDLLHLIIGLKQRTDKPIALITNGSLFNHESVFNASMHADIVLPTLCGYDETSFIKIHRPHPSCKFEDIYSHLIQFTNTYKGALWIEIMFLKGYNDHELALSKYRLMLNQLKYERLYLNTTVRPPTLSNVEAVEHKTMLKIAKALGGIPIDFLAGDPYLSGIEDNYLALKSLIKHHPMHQFEISAFLKSRSADIEAIIGQLSKDADIEIVHYKGFNTYRLR